MERSCNLARSDWWINSGNGSSFISKKPHFLKQTVDEQIFKPWKKLGFLAWLCSNLYKNTNRCQWNYRQPLAWQIPPFYRRAVIGSSSLELTEFLLRNFEMWLSVVYCKFFLADSSPKFRENLKKICKINGMQMDQIGKTDPKKFHPLKVGKAGERWFKIKMLSQTKNVLYGDSYFIPDQSYYEISGIWVFETQTLVINYTC